MEEHKKLGPRDVFMHLLAIITLYLGAVNFGVIIFQSLNIYLPDILTDQYFDASVFKERIRWALASLIIVFPVYVWLQWFLEKELKKFPEKREMRTRKWLIYFTLFLAAIVIIVNSITLVYNFLQGELTLRFVLKILTVFFISGAVFRYYLWILRKESAKKAAQQQKIFVWTVFVVVTAVALGGFLIAGLPQSQRLRRIDERRVQDLSGLQSQIVYFWQQKSRLPQTLDELKNSLSGYQPGVDPETGLPYEYRKLGDLQFELCANFHVESDSAVGKRAVPAYPYPYSESFDNWAHPAGRTCFQRTIDPELYKRNDLVPSPVVY